MVHLSLYFRGILSPTSAGKPLAHFLGRRIDCISLAAKWATWCGPSKTEISVSEWEDLLHRVLQKSAKTPAFQLCPFLLSPISIRNRRSPNHINLVVELLNDPLQSGGWGVRSFARFGRWGFGELPGWWAATVATYCPSRLGELPKFLSSKPCEWSDAPPCTKGKITWYWNDFSYLI